MKFCLGAIEVVFAVCKAPFSPLERSIHLSARSSITEQVNKLGVTRERKMIVPETEFSGRITKQFGYISF